MLAQITTQQWIMYGAMLGLMGLFYYRVLRAPSSQYSAPRRPLASLDHEETKPQAKSLAMPMEMMRWEVEMHDTARELKAELDTKMVALQTLIRSAREEQERLAKLIEVARGGREPLSLP
jgi:hypothetical protein